MEKSKKSLLKKKRMLTAKQKRTHGSWGKKNYISGNGLISRIYRKFLQLKNKQLDFKMGKKSNITGLTSI